MLEVETLVLGPVETNVYLVGDIRTKECVVIDPAWDGEIIAQTADRRGWTIQQIWLTHAHFDHVGYLDAFPNAKVFAHQKELAWVAGLPAWSIGYGSFSIEKIERVRKQMIVVYGERAQILPGIEVVYAGGHSAGSMAVVVNTKKGRVCLCGDNCFLYETIEEHLPIGLTNNLYESLGFMEKLSSMGDI